MQQHKLLSVLFLLLLTEALYRFTNIPNFNQPFTDQHNFGNYIDTILMNKINPDGWVAINCIPTAVHTIAGVLVGKLFLSNKKNKIKPLLIWAFDCLIVGYLLNTAHITPIIKRIATSSFTHCIVRLVFIGFSVLLLVDRYAAIIKDIFMFFLIVGMNSLFIYLFFEIVGSRWFNEYISAIEWRVNANNKCA